MVKKLHFLWMLVVSTPLFLAGCSDDDDRIITSTGALVFKSGGGEAVIQVVSDPGGRTVEITGDGQDHFTWTSSGDEITVKAPENTAQNDITAIMVIRAGKSTAHISLVQERSPKSSLKFTPDVEEYEFMARAGVYKIRVEGFGEWEPASDKEWLKAYREEGEYLVLEAGDNNGQERLSATVMVTYYGEVVRTIAVKQQIMSDNPYYALLGKWEIHCDKWYFEGEPVGGGTYSDVYFTELEANHRILMSKFFYEGAGLMPGTQQEIIYDYDPETGVSLKIPIGLAVRSYSPYVDYLAFTDIVNGRYGGGQLEAVISADYNSISFIGFPDGFGLGLLNYSAVNGYRFYGDLYYAGTSNIEFKKVEGLYDANAVKTPNDMADSGAPAILSAGTADTGSALFQNFLK